MGHSLLDEHTADRLLSGVLAPEDAPPGYAGVAVLLKAASQPPTPQETARCAVTVAAMSAAIASNPVIATNGNGHAVAPSVQTRRRAGLSRLLRPRIAATLTAGALALFGSLGAAGALPGPLQHAAHVAFGALGISVPDSDSGSSGGAPSGGSSGTFIGPTTPISAEPRGGTLGQGGPGTSGTPGRSHGHHGKNGHATAPQHHRHQGQHHHHKPGTHTTPTTGDQSALGPQGLCNAWSKGNGGTKGNKLSATSFKRLKAMADKNNETVAQFCHDTDQASASSNTSSGGSSGGDDSKGGKKSSGSGNEQTGADNSGHGGSHGGGNHGGTTARAPRGGHKKHSTHDAPPGDAGA